MRSLAMLLRSRTGHRGRCAGDERGTVMIEFALLLPVAMFLVLLLVQVTLLMVGRAFVHYSAQAAVRSATVQVPRDLGDMPGQQPNWIHTGRGDAKFDAIHAAAAQAIIPVSGRIAGTGDDAESYAGAMADYFQRSGRDVPRWVDTLLAERHRYAMQHTEVDLLRVEQSPGGTIAYRALGRGMAHAYAPREPVAVRVTHRLVLPVPYVKMMFADGSIGEGATASHYTTVVARSTLNNKGDRRDLPPAPSLPRRERR